VFYPLAPEDGYSHSHVVIEFSYVLYVPIVKAEGVKELGEAINEFILWNRREIVLDGPAMPKDKEASPLTKSPPPVPRFNETSLPLSPKKK
jgi:hypothetical protein